MVLANEASFEISLGRLKDMTVNTACQNCNQFCHYFFEAHFRIWGKIISDIFANLHGKSNILSLRFDLRL